MTFIAYVGVPERVHVFENTLEARKYVFDPHVHALAVAAVYTSTWHRCL